MPAAEVKLEPIDVMWLLGSLRSGVGLVTVFSLFMRCCMMLSSEDAVISKGC